MKNIKFILICMLFFANYIYGYNVSNFPNAKYDLDYVGRESYITDNEIIEWCEFKELQRFEEGQKYGWFLYNQEAEDLLRFVPKQFKMESISTFFKPYNRYFNHTCFYLKYAVSHPNCHCFWQTLEKSLAEKIKLHASWYLEEIIENTKLRDLSQNGYLYYYTRWGLEVLADPDLVPLNGKIFNSLSLDYIGDENLIKCEKFFEHLHWLNEFYQQDIAYSIVKHSHFYSDYSQIFQDIYEYSLRNFSYSECEKIKYELNALLSKLAPLFMELYDSCLSKHPNEHIRQEKAFLELELNNWSENILGINFDKSDKIHNSYYPANSEKDFCAFDSSFSSNSLLTSFNLESNPNQFNYNSPKYLDAKSQILLFQAANLNNLNLYKEAIHVINSILATNNHSYDLYLERAYSYFGLGKIDLAVNDYEEAQKYNVQPPFTSPKIFVDNVYIPKEKLQFSQGLFSGTIEGCKISAVEFLPSLSKLL